MQCKDRAKAGVLSKLTVEIGSLTFCEEVKVQEAGEGAPPGCAPAVIDDSTIVQLLLAGILDPQKEIEKLQKEKVMGIAILCTKGFCTPDYEQLSNYC